MGETTKAPGKRKWVIICSVVLLIIIIPVIVYLAADIEKKELNDSIRTELGGAYIKLPSGVTHYELKGPRDGKLVVLVHGATIPMYIWDEQFDDIASSGLQVLRYDQYGKGYSDRPIGSYNQEFYRQQLLELLDALGFRQPVNLVGLSQGAGLVMDFTASYPGRVASVAIIGPVINSIRDNTGIRLLRPPVWGEFAIRLIGTNTLAKRASMLTAKSVKAADYDRLFKVQTQLKGFERATLAMFRSDATEDYSADYSAVGKQAGRRVLLIWGTADGDITRAMVQQIQESVSPAKFAELKGVGHDPQVEVPEEVNTLIIDFMK